ncbi:fumarylacetoacetate hydrolase family protein [bacterium SGD-2]|nr:fumarylacetoacetate hydrolase family protein [bacterium SGD-2]
MKLLRYGPPGQEKPGILDNNGTIRDLAAVIPDIDASTLGKASLERLAALDVNTLPVVGGNLRIGAPIANIGKFIGIGLNYRDHANEAKLPIPTEPIIFMKANSCVVGPNDDVVLPRQSQKVDWEVELGIVIGTRARYVGKDEALSYVAGYCVVNDVSERHFQLERGGTWDKGKGFDTFGPVGPWLATADEVGDPQALDIWLKLNGETVQRSNTREMIFDCATIVSYVSELMTLMPGDVITTGTPAGVGMGMNPQRYLRAGDALALGVQGLGEQRQRIVAEG